jgi:hypothetical protein
LDLKKLTKGESLLGISALILVVLSFLPLWGKYEINLGEELQDLPGAFEDTDRFSVWSKAEVEGFSTGIGYGFIAKLAIILALLALIFVILRAAGVTMKLPVPSGQIYVGLAGLSLLLLLITLLTGPEGSGAEAFGVEIEVSRGLLLFIGLVLGAAMAFGAWMHMQEEGSAPTAVTGGPTTTPPPPAS